MTVHDNVSRPEAVVTLRIEERLKTELERVARLNDRSVSAQVRQMIRDGLRDYAENEAAA
jgi:hypothetical protein